MRRRLNHVSSPKLYGEPSMSNCIFCGGGRSEEHILGRWLIRDCKLEEENPRIGFGAEQAGQFETIMEKQRLSSFLLASVCQACNTRWMSALENKAKQALTPLLQAEWPVPDEVALLALRPACRDLTLWLLKTAVTFGEKMSVAVPESMKRELPKSIIRQGVFVDLACSEYSALWITMSRQWLVELNGKKEMRQHPESFRLTLQVRHLVLRVSYFPYTEPQQLKPRCPIVLYPRFRIPAMVGTQSVSGLVFVQSAHVYPTVRVLEDETTYRVANGFDPVHELGGKKIIAPW